MVWPLANTRALVRLDSKSMESHRFSNSGSTVKTLRQNTNIQIAQPGAYYLTRNVINAATHSCIERPFQHSEHREFIIANLGVCQSCCMRTKENTIEVILFEHSRQQTTLQQHISRPSVKIRIVYGGCCKKATALTREAADRNFAVDDSRGAS